MEITCFIEIAIVMACSVPTFEKHNRMKYMTTKSNFSTVAKMIAFVDKSILLKEIFQGGEFKLITAPQGFGKSTNLDMLKAFLSIPVGVDGKKLEKNRTETHRLFTKLQIYKKEPNFFYEHFGSFPVLHLDLKTDNLLKSFSEVIWVLMKKIHKSFKQHKYLCNSEKLSADERVWCAIWCDGDAYDTFGEDLMNLGLVTLAELLYKHYGKKVFVLVDNYDSLITGSIFTVKNVEVGKILKLVTTQISNLTRENAYVERGVITGVSYIVVVGLSGLKHIVSYRFLEEHPLVQFYGLTEKEVQHLFKQEIFELDPEEVSTARSLYDSYLSKRRQKIYRTQSVLKFLQKGEAQSYWQQYQHVESLMNVFKKSVYEKEIDPLLRDKSISVKFKDRITKADVLNLKKMLSGRERQQPNMDLIFYHLLELGYLTYDMNPKIDPNTVYVKFPNTEVKEGIMEYFLTLFAEA